MTSIIIINNQDLKIKNLNQIIIVMIDYKTSKLNNNIKNIENHQMT